MRRISIRWGAAALMLWAGACSDGADQNKETDGAATDAVASDAGEAEKDALAQDAGAATTDAGTQDAAVPTQDITSSQDAGPGLDGGPADTAGTAQADTAADDAAGQDAGQDAGDDIGADAAATDAAPDDAAGSADAGAGSADAAADAGPADASADAAGDVALPDACTVDADCAAMDDGDLCNGVWYCDTSGTSAVCAPKEKSAVTCPTDQDTDCAKATCAPSTGLCVDKLAADGAACDDGEGCTEKDACKAGVCAGVAKGCDDGDACTTDSCEASTGLCKHEAVPGCGIAPTWAEVWKTVVVDNGCMGCHGGNFGSGGMGIGATAEDTHAAWVGKATNGACAAAVYIKPGDASGSAVYLKVKKGLSAGCGGKMPKGTDGISDSDAALLKAWIDAGAKK